LTGAAFPQTNPFPEIAGLTPGDDEEPSMAARLFMSSGNLLADRRFDFARDLQLRGDLAAAATLLEQATELAPAFVSAWFTLGDVREQLGERDEAVTAFRAALVADPADRHGAALRLMRMSERPLATPSPGYVQALFDQYAPKFETALVDGLGYRGPAILFKAVLATRNAARKPAFFRRAIDLGCGTGLVARAFATQVDSFIGFDLSPRMIEKARAIGLYAQLDMMDMVQGLAARPEASADLILAADAVIYLHDLAPLMREVKRVLVPGGLFAFTAETCNGEGVVLGAGLRYAHSATYVKEAVASAGLTLSRLDELSARNEDNTPVPGLVVVATKS
jgi:predicted TPR repeat methyltransferase